jgi:hypothetical protein
MGAGSWTSRIGITLAAAGPPLLAIGVWRSFVSTHPVLAVFVLLCYEAVVAIVRFSGQVAGDLRDLWRQRLVDHIDRAVRRQVSRFGTQYRDYMVASQRFIDQKGLQTVGYYAPQLDDVFVDVSLAFRAPHQVPTGLLASQPTDPADRRSMDEFLDQQIPMVLAVVGAPGSGKTTLLRHTARKICLAGRGRRRTVPILLYLRDHAATIHTDRNVGIPELVGRLLRQAGITEPQGWFEQQLRKGNCVVLLDGLDEVASQLHRTSVAAWVESQVVQHPKNDYVITSRPQGYLSAPIHGTIVLNVLAFTDRQLTTFVHLWYLAVEQHTDEAVGDDVRRRAEESAEDLLDRLNRTPALYELTVNPLLLTMIVNVHRYRGILPGSRSKLYREICSVMLGLRQEAKKLPINLDGDRKETVLRALAYAMMRRRVVDLPRSEVIKEIGPPLRRMSRDLTPDDFMADVASNGLLVERENDLFSFAHLTFQEHLAAMHIRSRHETDVLVQTVGDSWWREVTLLYTAQADADPIVRACLESVTVPALALAFDCTEHDSDLAPELRDYLDNLLESVFNPGTTPEFRRLMAGVLATRHLRRMIRGGAGAGRICPAPITTGLYWLFQQDVPDREPDRLALVAPVANTPVTGVRGDDALTVARWVNDITGTGHTYRLPTEEELHDQATRRALMSASPGDEPLAVWVAPAKDGERPTLWMAPGTTDPRKIDADVVAEHIRQDLTREVTVLARILLVHTIVANRLLHTGLTRIVDLARAPRPMLIREVEVALGRARARSDVVDEFIDRSAELHRALCAALSADEPIDLSSAFDLAHAPRIALTRTHGPAGILEFADLDDMDRANRVLGSLVGDSLELPPTALERLLALDTVQRLDFDQALAAAAAAASSFNEGLALDAYLAFDRSVGIALSYAAARSLAVADTLDGWFRQFTREFLNFAWHRHVQHEHFVVSPDLLAEKIDHAWNIAQHVTEMANDMWTQQVIGNLRDVAPPVANRREPVTAENAGTIRILALCLAAEADVHGARALGDELREIVAGVTLLERRATGHAAPSETIILATS